MVDWKEHADQLLQECNLCMCAKPMHNAVEIQLEKDTVSKFGCNLNNLRAWGTDDEIMEACNALEPKLDHLKEKLVFEILKNGSVKY